MEKVVYLIRAAADAPGATLRKALTGKVAAALRDEGASEIIVNIHDEDTAAGQPIRRGEPPIRAMASFWLDDSDDVPPCESALGAVAERLDGFLVTESHPLKHERPRGERAPGMNQVTCITRRADLEYAEFIRIWHTDHKRVAIETQSSFGYVRNEILRPLTANAPAWTAIVEESFPIEALTDPKVFYDAKTDEEMKTNLKRMMDSCARFLDFEPMEMAHMSEYYLG